jgi:hypothetical protein
MAFKRGLLPETKAAYTFHSIHTDSLDPSISTSACAQLGGGVPNPQNVG